MEANANLESHKSKSERVRYYIIPFRFELHAYVGLLAFWNENEEKRSTLYNNLFAKRSCKPEGQMMVDNAMVL